jgi:hypothetical protein
MILASPSSMCLEVKTDAIPGPSCWLRSATQTRYRCASSVTLRNLFAGHLRRQAAASLRFTRDQFRARGRLVLSRFSNLQTNVPTCAESKFDRDNDGWEFAQRPSETVQRVQRRAAGPPGSPQRTMQINVRLRISAGISILGHARRLTASPPEMRLRGQLGAHASSQDFLAEKEMQ